MGRSGTNSLWSSGLTGWLAVQRTTGPICRAAQYTWFMCTALRISFDFDCVQFRLLKNSITCVTTHRPCSFRRLLAMNCQSYRVKPHGQLVLVSLTHYCASTPSLSTSWSRTTLQGALGPGKTHLETSFPLRCFQRLSLPHLATRRCHWRDNRYTRGASTPVLSY